MVILATSLLFTLLPLVFLLIFLRPAIEFVVEGFGGDMLPIFTSEWFGDQFTGILWHITQWYQYVLGDLLPGLLAGLFG